MADRPASRPTPTSFPTFSLAERDRRWNLARALMDEQGVEVLIVYGERDGSGPPQFTPDTYLTNDRMGSVVIFPRTGEPVALTWGQNAIADHYVASLRGDGVWLKPKNLRTGKNAKTIVEEIKARELESGTIGVVGLERFGPFHPEGVIPYATWKSVLEGLPGATFKPVGTRFSDLMLQKSPEEIKVLRWSARAGEAMCQAIMDVTQPGVPENEIYAAAMEVCYRHGATCYWIILSSGPDNISWGPPPWTYRPQAPRVIENGDVLMTELFVLYGMMETQQQLTVAVGDVHPLTEKCAALARECYEVGLEVIKPGARFGDVEAAMRAPLAKEPGAWNLTPMIHTVTPLQSAGQCGFGIEKLPGIDRYRGVQGTTPRNPDQILRPGMAFAFEPNCSIGKHRVNIGGTVVMTETGFEELNSLANYLQRV